jgi:DNA-binding NtrC family response regulator
MASRILVVDQEENFLHALSNRLESAGFQVEALTDASELPCPVRAQPTMRIRSRIESWHTT